MRDKKVRNARSHLCHIPQADGWPGLVLEWPLDCQPAADAGVARVEQWFAERYKSNLWMALHMGRLDQGRGFHQVAYETAFLWRLQQRLMAGVSSAVLNV
jgi:hypothetical protein